MFIVWVLVGLAVGWGGGRMLAFNPGGSAGDVVWGAAGSFGVAMLLQAVHTGPNDGSLVALIGGVAGALVATLIHRAYADRYQRPPRATPAV
jgi:uncharacterized membrane protein YeaQ/YmgE (transglycosylase-associated protein family)